MTLNDYAYINRFKAISIPEKVLWGSGMLLLALISANFVVWALIFIIMNLLMVTARIPLKYILKIWLGSLLFLLVSCATITVTISLDSGIGFSADGFRQAAQLFCRSLAGLSALLFVAVTTPIPYLVAYVARFEYLRPVAEIGLLTYRFLSVFLDRISQIRKAQDCRLGYSSLSQTLRSIQLIASVMGGQVFSAYWRLQQTMAARNYQGQIIYRVPGIPVVKWRLAGILALLGGMFWLEWSVL